MAERGGSLGDPPGPWAGRKGPTARAVVARGPGRPQPVQRPPRATCRKGPTARMVRWSHDGDGRNHLFTDVPPLSRDSLREVVLLLLVVLGSPWECTSNLKPPRGSSWGRFVVHSDFDRKPETDPDQKLPPTRLQTPWEWNDRVPREE